MKKLIIFALVISTILGMLTSCNTMGKDMSSGTDSDTAYIGMEMPEIPTENLAYAIVETVYGIKIEKINTIEKDDAIALAEYINNCDIELKYLDDENIKSTDGGNMKIEFFYENSEAVEFRTYNAYYVTNLCDGYFTIKKYPHHPWSINAYIEKVLEIDLWG